MRAQKQIHSSLRLEYLHQRISGLSDMQIRIEMRLFKEGVIKRYVRRSRSL